MKNMRLKSWNSVNKLNSSQPQLRKKKNHELEDRSEEINQNVSQESKDEKYERETKQHGG